MLSTCEMNLWGTWLLLLMVFLLHILANINLLEKFQGLWSCVSHHPETPDVIPAVSVTAWQHSYQITSWSVWSGLTGLEFTNLTTNSLDMNMIKWLPRHLAWYCSMEKAIIEIHFKYTENNTVNLTPEVGIFQETFWCLRCHTVSYSQHCLHTQVA